MDKERTKNLTLGTIFALAWPTMLEQLLQTAVQYLDTAMVGSLGTMATAAVGSTGTVNWLIMGMISAIGVGFLACISQSTGAGNIARAKKAAAQSVSATLFLGIIYTAVVVSISRYIPVWMKADVSIREIAGRYCLITFSPLLFRTASVIFGTVLRAAGDTKTPMKVGLTVNVINVVLNFLFIYPTRTVRIFSANVRIFGTGWGVEGAALASAVSYVAGGVLITIALFKHPVISPKGMSLKPDKGILKFVVKIAVPNVIQRFGTSFGFVVFASMINALGETATAAHTIANTVESAFYIPGWGMQAAAATLAGQSYGEGNNEKLKKLGKTIILIEVVLMIVSGGLLFILAEPFMHIFSKDPQVIALGARVLRMVALSEPFYGVPIVVEGMMQGLGKTKISLVFNVAGMWCVRITGTYICTKMLGMGLVSAWACMIGHNVLLFILFGILYLSGRWNPLEQRSLSSPR